MQTYLLHKSVKTSKQNPAQNSLAGFFDSDLKSADLA
jgi:hypothetical protein